MPRPLDSLRVLLIQARASEDMEVQEQACFQERCQLRPAQFVTANVVRDAMEPGLLEGVDAMMIGGAGEFSARKEYPWMDDLLGLVRTATDRDVPTFGSCWGHQIIARALGGEVVHDSARAEFGCLGVELTEAGQNDQLFRDFPHSFLANMGHHDRVDRLPDGAIELAFNGSQRNQAFRINDKPIYGTQFHSELDRQREYERLITYREEYRSEMPTEEAFQAVVDSLAETTEVDHLLHSFLVKYCVNDGS